MFRSSNSESSLLLWVVAAVVALLAAYLFVGWLRRTQGQSAWHQVLGPVLLAAAALGVGMTSAMVLALSAEGLAFQLGYRWLAVPALVLAPAVACLPAAWWLSRKQNWLALVGSGLMLAAVAMAVQVGWILAAGLRPGIKWEFELLGAAATLATLGFVTALWLAYSDASSQGARKTLWRVGAAALMALTLIAGQELVVSSAGLQVQVGSIYLREAAAAWLSLVAGAVVPTLLAVLALDLSLRNRDSRRSRSRSSFGSSFGSSSSLELNLPKRRKRRRKYRAL